MALGEKAADLDPSGGRAFFPAANAENVGTTPRPKKESFSNAAENCERGGASLSLSPFCLTEHLTLAASFARSQDVHKNRHSIGNATTDMVEEQSNIEPCGEVECHLFLVGTGS